MRFVDDDQVINALDALPWRQVSRIGIRGRGVYAQRNERYVTPIFFIGATAGSVVAGAFGLNPARGAALGMVGTMAGCANTPTSASVVAIRLFGATLGPYAAVTCIVSLLIAGHRSAYPSQIPAIAKSASFKPDL